MTLCGFLGERMNKQKILDNKFKRKSFRDRFSNVTYDIEELLGESGLFKPRDILELDNGCKIEFISMNFEPVAFGVNIQRGYEWQLEDKRYLIDSIYKDSNIGYFIIRRREQQPRLSVLKNIIENKNRIIKQTKQDCIDGKHRIKTLFEFVTNQFSDFDGIYFKDFSETHKNKFMSFRNFSCVEMSSETTDLELCEAMRDVNKRGVKVSQEHLDFIDKLIKDNS